jgi:hypothetical protein
VAQKLVQKQFDILVLQSYHLDLVSLRRHAASNLLGMLSKKVYGGFDMRRHSSEIDCLLLLAQFSGGILSAFGLDTGSPRVWLVSKFAPIRN